MSHRCSQNPPQKLELWDVVFILALHKIAPLSLMLKCGLFFSESTNFIPFHFSNDISTAVKQNTTYISWPLFLVTTI